ncbi:hypothetical protein ACGYLX_18915, partial [Sulfitobacter sp. 1A13496]|uniref:hypothetical protein n=1 Tax=Sulfitobacter sp. 1A13496 TaxID=3368596 RepID=UPI003746209D
MAVYLVSYDLRNEQSSADYQPLFDRLKRYDCHRIQDSVWLVAINSTAIQLRKYLAEVMDSNDLLWVSQVRRG